MAGYFCFEIFGNFEGCKIFLCKQLNTTIKSSPKLTKEIDFMCSHINQKYDKPNIIHSSTHQYK